MSNLIYFKSIETSYGFVIKEFQTSDYFILKNTYVITGCSYWLKITVFGKIIKFINMMLILMEYIFN